MFLTFKKIKFQENSKKRINVKKILSLDEIINKPYSKVTIELKKILKSTKLKKFYQKMETTNKLDCK